MKTKPFFMISLLALSWGLTACKKDNEPNKIVYSVPIRSGEVVIPAFAVQEFGLLKRESMRVIIVSLNQISISTAPPTLLSEACPNYTFQVSEAHIGSVLFTIQFQDDSNLFICPVNTSSASVKYVRTISVAGSSSLFGYTDTSSLLTLTSAGDVTSDISLTDPGTTLTGLGAAVGYTLSFVVPAPGARVNAEGLRGGAITATGTGPGPTFLPIAMTLATDNNHSIDGSISWEGQSGGIHVGGSGVGFVVTNDARIPFN